MANMSSNSAGEIEEEESTPLISDPKARSVTTKVPEAEVHVYRQGKGPIEVIKAPLGGWDQDQLEVRDILDRFSFKTLYAFTPGFGRGVAIRFNPRNGRSILAYKDGAVIYVDGQPKDSLINPITRILVGVVLLTVLIVMFMKEGPEWAKKLNFDVSGARVPPWVLACAVILFTRLRKRTKTLLEKYF